VTLAKALDRKLFDVTVFTFYPGGALEQDLAGSHVRTISLGKSGRWDVLRFFSRLVRHLRLIRPDIIHGYLDLSNLLALSSKPFTHRPAIIWGARSSNVDLKFYDRLRRLSFWLERKLSRLPDRIIVNSDAGRAYLLKRGFPAEKLVVVPNGIDTNYFRPDTEARRRVRSEWGVSENEVLIGIVGRFDPVKDHQTFLRAAALLSKERASVRFVCVGGGTVGHWQKLHRLCEQLSLSGKVLWAGARSDMPAVYNAFDIHVSSSRSEGFPNSIGEAMACAVPCVVTDAGDSSLIVGDTGFVSAPLNVEALALNLIACIESDREGLGKGARLRIEENWNTEQLAERSERVITSLIGDEGRKRAFFNS
jgi:glycosyltransferase involved in cell wall biosynthesis